MHLNSAFAQGCLTRHNDILRAGRMRVNAALLEWEPTSCGSKENSLASFASALSNSKALPQHWRESLDELVYCIMKSLSFQFVLMDVLRMLQDEFELESTPTIPSDGIEYSVNLAEVGCDAAVFWPKKSKIFTLDIETGEKRFYGAIQALQTRFKFPPDLGEVQTYHVEMRVPRQRLVIFKGKVNTNIKLVTHTPLMRPEGAEQSATPKMKRSLCTNGCGRIAASGYDACCRTCVLSERASHGPTCERRTASADLSGDFSPGSESAESLSLSVPVSETFSTSRTHTAPRIVLGPRTRGLSGKGDFESPHTTPKTRGARGYSSSSDPAHMSREIAPSFDECSTSTESEELLPLIFSVDSSGG